MSRAFTMYTSTPASSKMSYTGILYTPVLCMATVRIPHCFNQADACPLSTLLQIGTPPSVDNVLSPGNPIDAEERI